MNAQPPLGPGEPRRVSFLVPRLAAVLVTVFSLTLLVIGARSPYTHANLQPGDDPSYTRTEPIFAGPPASHPGIRDVVAVRVEDDPAATGARVFVVAGCAGCHALEGAGGAVGPRLTRLTLSVFQKNTRQGPAGMPSYSRQALDDDEIVAVIGYLRALREASPPQTGGDQGYRGAVEPLLRQQCLSCHGLNGKGGYSVIDWASVLRGGLTGPAVVPWDAEASLLIQKLRPSPPFGERMPPDEPPLDKEVIEPIVKWIERGAPND